MREWRQLRRVERIAKNANFVAMNAQSLAWEANATIESLEFRLFLFGCGLLAVALAVTVHLREEHK